jgi:hypothetical protein
LIRLKRTQEQCVSDYAERLDGLLKKRASATADLVTLGLGEDGHIASIFPALNKSLHDKAADPSVYGSRRFIFRALFILYNESFTHKYLVISLRKSKSNTFILFKLIRKKIFDIIIIHINEIQTRHSHDNESFSRQRSHYNDIFCHL